VRMPARVPAAAAVATSTSATMVQNFALMVIWNTKGASGWSGWRAGGVGGGGDEGGEEKIK
jgi:hypothetical protein